MTANVYGQFLNAQADRIEMVLSSHRVATRVWGGVVAPRFVTFELTSTMGTRVKSVAALSDEIAMVLGVSRCRIYRDAGTIRIEVPRGKGASVSLLSLCRGMKRVSPASMVLGVDRSGYPLIASLSSPDIVHVLVSGTTGSGKTEALRSMVMSLAYLNRQHECQLLLIDPKGRGLLPFDGLPHLVAAPVTNPGDAQEALEDMVEEMERRDRLHVCLPRVVVVIDELADLLMVGGNAIKTALTRLGQRGRGAGIHLVAATQKPSAETLSPVIRSNFPMRIVGRVVSAGDAHIATGISGSRAEQLLGRGDMLAVTGGQCKRFQAAYVSESEIVKTVRWLRSRQHARAGSVPGSRQLASGRERSA